MRVAEHERCASIGHSLEALPVEVARVEERAAGVEPADRRQAGDALRVAIEHGGPGAPVQAHQAGAARPGGLVAAQVRAAPARAAPARRRDVGPRLAVVLCRLGETGLVLKRSGERRAVDGAARRREVVRLHEHLPDAHQLEQRIELARDQAPLLDQVVDFGLQLARTARRIAHDLAYQQRPARDRRGDAVHGVAPPVEAEQRPGQHEAALAGRGRSVEVRRGLPPVRRYVAVCARSLDCLAGDQRQPGQERQRQGQPWHPHRHAAAAPPGEPAGGGASLERGERHASEARHGEGEQRRRLVSRAQELQ